MRRRTPELSASFSMMVPLPRILQPGTDYDDGDYWEEVEWEVEGYFDEGEPVSWECPGSPPGVEDIECVYRILPDERGNFKRVGPDIFRWIQPDSEMEREMMEALERAAEDLAVDVPSSHRFYYY
jgi:hypothetical protein